VVGRIKTSSGNLFHAPLRMQALLSRITIGVIRTRRGASMADLAYAVLLIAIFAALALTLRGLERL
jgi:hypothetical protein